MTTPEQPSIQTVRARKKSQTRRNAAKVEHYLMEVEKMYGCARSWALRVRLERGDVTLAELGRR
jgi:hypothetical protein